MDEIDMKIIQRLKENARISFSSIARELKLSETAIRKRVDRLLRKGVIRQFTVELNLGFRAIVFAAVEPKVSCVELARKILSFEGVEKVYEISGEYDLAVFLSARSYLDANKTIDAIRSLDGVRSTYTVAVLGVHH